MHDNAPSFVFTGSDERALDTEEKTVLLILVFFYPSFKLNKGIDFSNKAGTDKDIIYFIPSISNPIFFYIQIQFIKIIIE